MAFLRKWLDDFVNWRLSPFVVLLGGVVIALGFGLMLITCSAAGPESTAADSTPEAYLGGAEAPYP